MPLRTRSPGLKRHVPGFVTTFGNSFLLFPEYIRRPASAPTKPPFEAPGRSQGRVTVPQGARDHLRTQTAVSACSHARPGASQDQALTGCCVSELSNHHGRPQRGTERLGSRTWVGRCLATRQSGASLQTGWQRTAKVERGRKA